MVARLSSPLETRERAQKRLIGELLRLPPGRELKQALSRTTSEERRFELVTEALRKWGFRRPFVPVVVVVEELVGLCLSANDEPAKLAAAGEVKAGRFSVQLEAAYSVDVLQAQGGDPEDIANRMRIHFEGLLSEFQAKYRVLGERHGFIAQPERRTPEAHSEMLALHLAGDGIPTIASDFRIEERSARRAVSDEAKRCNVALPAQRRGRPRKKK